MSNDQYPPSEPAQSSVKQAQARPKRESAQTTACQHIHLLEALPYPAWIKNRRAEYLYANKAYSELLGQPVHTIKGKTDRQIFPRHLHQQLAHSDAQVFKNKQTVELDDIVLFESKADKFWLSKSPLIDASQQTNGILGIMKPSAADQTNTQSLPDLALTAVRNSNEAVIITDDNFKIIFVNSAFSSITGYSQSEVINKPANEINTNWLAPEFMDSIQHNLHYHDYWEGEAWNRNKDGNLYSENIKISVARSPDRKVSHYIGQFTDNTEQRQAQEKLEFLAFHDPLTGLANRALFLDRVTRCIQMAERNKNHCAVIYLDLNDFKPLNDRYGHPFGDEVLKKVADKLHNLVRKVDTVSRQGGDEFALLLEETTSIEGAILVAQKVIASLKEPMQINDQTINIGASAGIAVYPDHGKSSEKLIGNADKAMYAAKFLGGNGYYLYK